jgi:hypothetical protein
MAAEITRLIPIQRYWRGASGHRDQFQDVSRSRAVRELFGGVMKDTYLDVGSDEPARTARMEHAVVVVRTKYAQALTDRPGTTSATGRSRSACSSDTHVHEKSRHHLGEEAVVRARSVVSGLHHDYSPAPALA